MIHLQLVENQRQIEVTRKLHQISNTLQNCIERAACKRKEVTDSLCRNLENPIIPADGEFG